MKNANVSIKTLLDISTIIVVALNKKGEITHINKTGSDLLGESKEALTGKNWLDLPINKQEIKSQQKLLSELINGSTCRSEQYERTITKSNNRITTILWQSSSIKDENDLIIGTLHTGQDITIRKLAEEERALKDKVFEASLAANSTADKNGIIQHTNQSFLTLWGYESKKEVLNKPISFFFYDTKEAKDVLESLQKTDRWHGEFIAKRKDGSTFICEGLATAVRDEQGELIGYQSTNLDVSATKKAIQELKEKDNLLTKITENYPHAYLSIIEKDLTVGFTSGQEFKNQKLDPNDFIGLSIEKIFTDKCDIIKKHYLKTFQGEEQTFELFINNQHQLYNTVPLPNEKGEINRILAVAENITFRKKSEKALKESLQTATNLVKAMPSGIFIYQFKNPDKLILISSNPEAKKLTGLKTELWIGKEFNEIWPEAKKSGLFDAYLNVIKTGEHYETEDLHYTDATLTGAFKIKAFSIPGKRLVVAFDNITERKKVEYQIQKNLIEKEVMLKELHHRVKNNLNVVTSLLNLQAKEITDKKSAIEAFNHSVNRIHSMALIHEKLYQSADFSIINFKEYTIIISNELLEIYDTNNRITIEYDLEEVLLNINLAIPCGLILNELITNAIKHAFTAKKEGQITVSFHQKKNYKVTLSIQDNGIGLPENIQLNNPTSLGLQLIKILTEQIEGKISIKRENGTTFNIEFDQQQK